MEQAADASSRFLTDTNIELINPAIERGRIRFALFDFDGTISLIREGWQAVMLPMMVEILSAQPDAEDEAAIHDVVKRFVAHLTGKQTIYQMMQLCEEIKRRGGEPEEPLHYKKMYLDRLWQRIEDRVVGLQEGRCKPEDHLVAGSAEIIKALHERGVRLFLASGTDEVDVLREAALLGVDQYFNGGIYGAQDEYQRFSKKMLIERMFRDNDLRGVELVAFGDGYVEIENTKEVGGVAVGVASDEQRREGIDAWKRDRLIKAGADLIIPEFREWRSVIAYLFREEPLA